MMKKIAFLFLLATLISCSQKELKNKFVRVNQTHFEVDGKPYNYIGVNMWYAAYLGATPEGRQRLVKELDTLKALGVTNIRILGASEKSALIVSLPKAMQTSPGVYDDKLMEGLDFTLSEMAKRNMYAVIYLNNFWQWSGGMSQYKAWVDGNPVPDPDVTKDWTTFMDNSAMFYTSDSAQTLYRNYINYLINRKNTITGLVYKDDPAIMAWELSNEPRPGAKGNDSLKIENMRKWIDQTAAYIHSIDPNHLVTTGTEGAAGCLDTDENFYLSHNSKNIDFVNFHLWAKNWGWFDANNIDSTLAISEKKAVEYIGRQIAVARRLNKPITFEEFGIDRDSTKCQPGTPIIARDKYFSLILNVIADSAAAGSPLVGANIWAWGGYAVPYPVDKVVDTPAAMMGDPLGEAQGLNSVYVSDTSTLRLIKNCAVKLNALNNK
jgi:mannan endo-1,4-beta-mannosidase